MRKIGFIGAESKHAAFFGKLVSEGVDGIDPQGTHIFAPDTPELVSARIEEGQLAGSCGSLEELLEISDAIMILTRCGDSHKALAERCLRSKKPVFVDKPFACSPADAAAILECALKNATPVMGGSTLCFLPETAEIAALAPLAREITVSFPADWYSPYGGWYYYGSHLTDLCAAIGGCAPSGFYATREGPCVTARVFYPELTIVLNSSPELTQLQFSVKFAGSAESVYTVPDYERCYRLGLERFSAMINDGLSVNPDRLLFSAHLMSEIVKTLSER